MSINSFSHFKHFEQRYLEHKSYLLYKRFGSAAGGKSLWELELIIRMKKWEPLNIGL